ncbi:MAG: MMPL family transporter [Bacteroidetes bacterium]|nr:MMPL family transporter [Bacteroidota bacterium]HET6245639.1 MMPL family transporter [Bacteroidia bacterium]
MWGTICSLILRNRVSILILLGLFTGFMAYKASTVRMDYEFLKLLPSDDPTLIDYEDFKNRFGEDGNILAIGLKEPDLFKLDKFISWYNLGNRLKAIEGVDEVISLAHIYNLSKNDSIKKFDFLPVVKQAPTTQEELDSLKEIIFSLPFYNGRIYNESSGATLMAVSIDKKIVNSAQRDKFMLELKEIIHQEATAAGLDLHYSGLPYIRSNMTTKVAAELKLFILLAIFVTAFILFLFFRSIKITLFSMMVVAIGVIYSLGTVAIFDFRITILLALIPPLIIVIGIPNCIFMLNKYHREYKIHGNQAKALIRSIQKIGGATLLTNTTTALGFAAFIVTNSRILQEFGIVASINILCVFVLSLLLIPIIFSYFPPPNEKNTKHLENKLIFNLVERFVVIVTGYRKTVYIVSAIAIALAINGITKIQTTGNIVDDLPIHDPIVVDLMFFQENFSGVMPFEISIDAKKPGAASQISTLKKIDQLQDLISSYPEFSKPVSMAEVVKFSKQAYYNGSPDRYSLPSDMEKSFLAPYFTAKTGAKENILRTFIDSTKRYTRVSVQMADIGTKKMQVIKNDIKPRIDSIFDPEKFDVVLTGNSIVFLKGTNFLVKNLFTSLALAIVVISILMAFLFSSYRMVFVSLVPNFIPLLVTAGLMGYFGIAIKPSTILVFSIAFGISVDDTIHYLAKYRQELKVLKWNIKDSVIAALRESGVSMIYTSIVLFFGFGIFSVSNFGGTVALGILVAVTLFVAMLSNLIVLPCLLLSLEKSLTTKAFKEPLVQIIDEEEDIELKDLVIGDTSDPNVPKVF